MRGLTFHSVAYLVILGIGLVLMFFFNTPGKNTFRTSTCIWNTYNNVSGLVWAICCRTSSLFAIGLRYSGDGLQPVGRWYESHIPVVCLVMLLIFCC